MALHWLSEWGCGAQQSLPEGRWRKGWKGSFSCWQITVRSVFLRSTSYAFGLQLSCSAIGFFSSTFTLRAFFCCWYMPAKLNFLSQIKCISQSLKPRKSLATPPLVCCSDEFLLSPAPHLHSTQHKGAIPCQGCCPAWPHPYRWPQKWVRFVTRRNERMRIRSSPDDNLTSPEQRLEQLPYPIPKKRQQPLFIFIAGKFCASNQQGQHFHLKANRVQDHRACRHFYP